MRDKGYLSVKEGLDAVNVGKVAKWKLVTASVLDRLGLWQIYLKHRRAQLEKRSAIGGAGAETVRSATALSAVDWETTKAYFSSMSARSVRLNMKGREASGVVDEKDCDEFLEKLANALLEMRDEDGTKVIAKVFKAKEVFKGDFVKNASDLYLEPAVGYSFNQGFAEKTVMPSTQHGQPRSGDHRQYGIYMLQGKGVRQGETIPASIMDVTPTILALMGIPLSDDLDGKVLAEALTEEPTVRRYKEAPYGQAEKTVDENEEKLQERLKDLGYL